MLGDLDHLDTVGEALQHLGPVARVKASFFKCLEEMLFSVEGTEEHL
jgi:hypothetical protein